MDQGEEKPKHPLTGEPYDEEAERARLIPAEEVTGVSKELKVAFEEYVNNQLIPSIQYKKFDQRSAPEELFFAREVKPMTDDANARRVYFKRDDRHPFGFREAFELTFDKPPKINEVTRFYVHLVGEEFNAPYEEIDSFTIACEQNRTGTLNIQSKINSRVLRVKYWEGGKIDVVEFNSDLRLHINRDDIALTDEVFQEVKEKKSKEVIESRGAQFEVTYNKEKDNIEVKRVLDGKQTDFISFPMQIDYQKVQNKILTGRLIDEPVKTNTDEDIQWKSVTLKDLGINWQRE